MRNARKLSLKRESLTQLSNDEMASVAGGSHYCGITDYCTDDLTHNLCVTIEVCPTFPVGQCINTLLCIA